MRVTLPALCVALLFGCISVAQPRYPLLDAATALGRRDATTAALSSIRAEARVDQRGPTGRIRGTVLMFVERAGKVRFDVMTQFGPVAILTSDRERFAFADLREHRYLTGATCPNNIARLLGVPLSVEDTSHFLLAGTPIIVFQQSSLHWERDGFYRAVLSAQSGAQQELDLAVYPADVALPTSRQRLYLLRSELFAPGGRRVWRVTYQDYAAVLLGREHVLLPMRVRVEQSASASDTLIHFKEIVLNPRIPEEAFLQTPRPGMQEEEATCE